MQIESKNFRGVPVGPEHLDPMARLHSDPRVTATLGGSRNRAQIEAYLKQSAQEWVDLGWGQWAFFDKEDTFIGRCGLRPYLVEGTEEVELLYAITAESWGKGYATEAARATIAWAWKHTAIDDIVAFTLPTNIASQRVMEKSGMTRERHIIHADLDHVLYRVKR